MIRKLVLAGAIAAFVSPALAFQCPADMARIDAALETADLSDAERAQVLELRQQGEELHAAGQHQESMDALAEAIVILGL